MDKAQLLGSAGDFSAYSELGYSDAEIRRLKNAYDQAQVASLVSSLGSSSSSGGSSSRSSKQSVSDSSEDAKQDYEGLFQLAYQNRANAKSVIANNYKKYGFTSQTGLYDEFQAWAEEHEGEQEEEQEEEDETASKLRLNQVLNLWNDVPKVGSSISAASASGYSEKSENYETVEKRLSEMDAEGASKAEILVALQRAKQQGVLNLTDYNKLFYKINN